MRWLLCYILTLTFASSRALAQAPVDYKTQIDPIFAKYSCKECHGGADGLSLDTYQHLLTTGVGAPVVVARDTNCILIRRLKGSGVSRMPPSGAVLTADLQLVIRWVREGASEKATHVRFAESDPQTYRLFQNYPYPFNPRTTISFSIAQPEFVELGVYDILGNKITTLLSQSIGEGKHEVPFDASQLGSGIYFYRLQTVKSTLIRMMIVAK